MSNAQLDGRVTVVTGAAQGIGRAIAERYAAEGASVAVVDTNEKQAAIVAKQIEDDGGTAMALRCDVSSRAEVDATANAVVQAYGPITVLVSNAGVSNPAMLWKMTEQQWDQVMDIHLKGSFFWLQAVVSGMREARTGSIIFTTSAAGITGTIGQINYATAKAGLLGMTRSAAQELASHNITVNAVAPSAATPMTETIRSDERFKDKYLQSMPLSRWAEPDEIAGTYVFLAATDTRYMTGQVLSIDGGRVMTR